VLSLLARDVARETGDLTIEQVWLEGEDRQPRAQFHGKEKDWVCIEYHRDNHGDQTLPSLSGFACMQRKLRCVLRLGPVRFLNRGERHVFGPGRRRGPLALPPAS